MSKMKVQDATKELSRRAAKLLGDVTSVRIAAEKTLAEMRKLESSFVKQEEAEREEKRREEQQKALSAQSKAWTMPDDVPVAEEKAEEKPADKAAESRKEPSAAARPAADARPAQEAKHAPEAKHAERPAARAPQPGAQAGRPAQREGAAPRQAQGQQPRPGNPAARPGQGRPAQGAPRPMGAQGGNFVPRNAQGGPRPFGQGGSRPAGGAGGRPMSGRPAGGRGSKGPELMPTVEKERVSNYDPNKRQRQRQHDPERQPVKNRKQLARDTGYGMEDDVVRGRRKKGRQLSAQQKMAPIKIETAYMTAETITVRDLTERIGKPAGEIIKKLMLLGIMATINQELDFDTASLVASEFGVTLEMKLDKTAEDALSAENVEDNEEDLVTRPPVVTIMGHVDHGKTSLLDYIRKTKVTAGEAGGITQHIGAYTASVDGRQITFLDTPGHEAFTAMRARGTQATDIAILVVAADDGVMPQTVESINHAKAAKCPIIVAINKIDKPAADPDAVKQELTRYELVPEEWGGDTIMVPVSAHTGEGIDELLENVLLLADVLELKANPNRKARGVIIEAKLDHSRGAVATALVQNGTLRVGDMVVAGNAYGRVRAMVSSRGERVKQALPSTPVEIIGFGGVPEAGDEFMAVADEKLARQVVEERAAKVRASMVKTSSASTLEDLYSRLEEGEVKDLNIIIKADVQGSVEAVKQSLEKLSNSEVRVRTIHSGVGAVTENDVMLAGIDGAIIIGFNVRPDAKAREAANRDGIDIRYYRVIYQAIEDVEKAMKGLLAPEFRENVLGHAEVRNVFKITNVGIVAGCYVTDGLLQRNAQVRLLRDNVVVYEGKLSSLQRFKDAVKEVKDGYECGVCLENYTDIKEGDIIECFVMEEIAR
ncbi:MAG TPA: translation initiation factor IF-2 [Candidatus Ventricola intestinavium]|nr:translation initiation factor IF-2 [Candidatus Ventricola intestinavium]